MRERERKKNVHQQAYNGKQTYFQIISITALTATIILKQKQKKKLTGKSYNGDMWSTE